MGVCNGWGYGIAIFRALNFQISEPEIWQKSLFLREQKTFSHKTFSGLPGHRSSRSGIRTKRFMFLGFRG